MSPSNWDIVARERPTLIKYLRQYKQGDAWSEDVISLGTIKVIESIDKLRDEKVFKTWYWTICINCARNELRLPMYRGHVEFKDMRVEAVQYTVIRDMEHDLIIANVIAGLPEIQGLVFKLRYVDELSFKEIAEIMDCPYDTAKANFRHAFLRVKEYLSDRIIKAEY